MANDNSTPRQDYDLGWKRHDDFFASLNTKLDDISSVGESCYINYMNVYIYFSKVKNLYNKHRGYLQDSKDIYHRLSKIEETLFEPNLLRDIKNKKQEAQNHVHKLFILLQEVFSEMTTDFTIPELLPKPIKKEKEEWDNEKDYKKKAMYKTVQLIFENV